MKKIIISVVIMSTVVLHSNFAQDTSPSPIDNVITSYLDLKNALTIDRADSARIAAKSLREAIDQVPMDKLSKDHHKVWMKYNEKLSYDAGHIQGTDDISHQREHFVSLSSTMYDMIKSLNMNEDILYYQFCPMANEGKGAYWMSEDSVIRNPYMGKRMPKCGSTKETLKSN